MNRSILMLLLTFSIGIPHLMAAWGDLYRSRIEQIKRNPTSEAMVALGKDLANDYERPNRRSPTELAILSDVRGEFCQIPGHAQYFADELERMRAGYPPGDYKEDYRRKCVDYLVGILPHLPSPESVRVLCGYVSDERDAPPEDYKDWSKEIPYPSTSGLAGAGLSRIGLRDAPEVPGSYMSFYDKPGWEKARAWYEEIRSGKRPFSFKGQSVEHRFKPDGTWISTPIANPPDDAPPLPPAKSAQPAPTRPSDTPPLATAPVSRPFWPWITGGVLTILAALGYAFKSRRHPAG